MLKYHINEQKTTSKFYYFIIGNIEICNYFFCLRPITNTIKLSIPFNHTDLCDKLYFKMDTFTLTLFINTLITKK